MEEMDIRVVETTGEAETIAVPHPDPDVQFEPDAEDLAADELSHQDLSTDKYEAYLVVDADNGGNIMQHKSSILHILFSNNDPNSTDRLRCVMDLSHFDPAGRGLAIGQTFDLHEPRVSIQDPAATLVRSKDLIWLVFVQIVNLHFDNAGIQAIPTRSLGEPNVHVKVRGGREIL